MYQRSVYFIILLLIAVACGKAPQPEQDTTAPSVPSGLNAIASDDSVALTWAANSEEDLKHYTIYQGIISGNLSKVDTVAAGAESFVATGLEPRTYYFAISAEDSSGNASGQSPEVSATLVTPDEAAPTIAATLPADGETDAALNIGISVTFSEAMGQAVTESAFSSDPATECIFTWDVASTILSCEPTTELSANTTYTVTVGSGAQDLAGNGLETPFTFSFTTGQTADTTPPAAPTNLTAEASSHSVTLSWQANGEEDLKGYKVYRGTSNGTLTPIADVYAGTETFVAGGLTQGTSYVFAVAAEDSAGNLSERSGEVSATPVAQEGSLTVLIDGLPAGSNADVTVDGPNGFSQTLTKTQTLTLAPGSYSVTAKAVVGTNNFGYSPNPVEQTVDISVGSESQVDTTYVISSGSLFLAVTGLSLEAEGDILVTGPGGFSQKVTGSAVLTNLEPGAYGVRSQSTTSDDAVFQTTGATEQSVLVSQGDTTQVDVTYSCVRIIFQDSYFETLIRSVLDQPSGDVTCQDMTQLSEIDKDFNKLFDISGLQHAVNLSKFKITITNVSGQITDLSPLKTLTELEELRLSNQKIDDLTPLANLTKLKVLFLYRNRVTDLSPLAALTSLEVLIVTPRTILDASPTELEGDALSPLANLTALKHLYLSDNNITDFSPLAGLPNLTFLQANDNNIGSLDSMSGLTALEILRLENNAISNLAPLSGLSNLKTLNLNGNNIQNLSGLESLSKLETLNLNDNAITALSPLEGLSELRFLNLQSNTIKDITALATNTGLGENDTVTLHYNCLNLNEGTKGAANLATLEARGVNVYTGSQMVGEQCG